MGAVRQLAELVERRLELALRVEERERVGRADRADAGQVQTEPEGEQPLLGAVVQRALDPAPLRLGGAVELRPRLPQPFREELALGDERRQAQARDGGDGDEDLGVDDAVARGADHERALVVGRRPDGDRHDRGDRQRRALRAEAHRRPDQRREEQVGDGLVAVGRDLGERRDDDEQEGALDEAAVERGPAPGRRPPRDRERDDDEGAAEIAEPPGPRHLEQRIGLHDPGQRQRDRADDGADRGAEGESADDVGDAREALERLPALQQPPDQPRGDEDLEHVAAGLPERRTDREGRVVVREQVAGEDSRPQREPEERQARHRDPTGSQTIAATGPAKPNVYPSFADP